ncbi:hypothetical protein [Streptomyces spiramyceticus]|uniref:hypothetical protein n=1 Tax=Streptomyces spiramyceticus TaxID=299717 RepID=UPI00237BAA2B|nr:hypothetical protein [Streptomyces spiramyceticus]
MSPDELFPEVPPGPIALCCHCHNLTGAPVAVRWIESTSGPGTTLDACPEDAAKLGAGPTPDVIHTP